MVIYEYEVPGGALNISSTKLPRPWEYSPTRKNSHGKTGNRILDLMISSQKPWPLNHEVGRLLQKGNVMKMYDNFCFGLEKTEAKKGEETYRFSGKYKGLNSKKFYNNVTNLTFRNRASYI
jgi:hypothetical protein